MGAMFSPSSWSRSLNSLSSQSCASFSLFLSPFTDPFLHLPNDLSDPIHPKVSTKQNRDSEFPSSKSSPHISSLPSTAPWLCSPVFQRPPRYTPSLLDIQPTKTTQRRRRATVRPVRRKEKPVRFVAQNTTPSTPAFPNVVLALNHPSDCPTAIGMLFVPS